MTKERLNNLIKQRGFVYVTKDNKIIKINLETCIIDDNLLLVGYDFCFDDCEDCYDISRLYETREQAEWGYKMHAERTERFEPPMWEDIKGYYRFNFMNCENGVWKKYSFELLKKQDDKAKEGGCISIWTGTKDIYNKTTPTKENYEKACEIVRDLFKGEK